MESKVFEIQFFDEMEITGLGVDSVLDIDITPKIELKEADYMYTLTGMLLIKGRYLPVSKTAPNDVRASGSRPWLARAGMREPQTFDKAFPIRVMIPVDQVELKEDIKVSIHDIQYNVRDEHAISVNCKILLGGLIPHKENWEAANPQHDAYEQAIAQANEQESWQQAAFPQETSPQQEFPQESLQQEPFQQEEFQQEPFQQEAFPQGEFPGYGQTPYNYQQGYEEPVYPQEYGHNYQQIYPQSYSQGYQQGYPQDYPQMFAQPNHGYGSYSNHTQYLNSYGSDSYVKDNQEEQAQEAAGNVDEEIMEDNWRTEFSQMSRSFPWNSPHSFSNQREEDVVREQNPYGEQQDFYREQQDSYREQQNFYDEQHEEQIVDEQERPQIENAQSISNVKESAKDHAQEHVQRQEQEREHIEKQQQAKEHTEEQQQAREHTEEKDHTSEEIEAEELEPMQEVEETEEVAELVPRLKVKISENGTTTPANQEMNASDDSSAPMTRWWDVWETEETFTSIKYYMIQEQDDMNSIVDQYKISRLELLKANKQLEEGEWRTGMRIRIPRS